MARTIHNALALYRRLIRTEERDRELEGRTNVFIRNVCVQRDSFIFK